MVEPKPGSRTKFATLCSIGSTKFLIALSARSLTGKAPAEELPTLNRKVIVRRVIKRVLFTILAVLVGAGASFAQTPSRTHSLSLDVRPVSSGGATRSRNNLKIQESPRLPGFDQLRNESFSASRTRGSGVGLDLEVKNFSRQNDEATLEWYFVGKQVTGGSFFVFDQGSQKVQIRAGSREIVEIQSKELTSTVEKNLERRSGYVRGTLTNESSASVKRSGYKAAGWIVRLMADGQLLQVRASAPSLDTIGKNESQLGQLPRGPGVR